MVNEKRSVNDLAKFYYGCPLFKKYCNHKFWGGKSNVYDNFRYCKEYIYRAARALILRHLFQSFSLAFILVLYTSPSFMKFIKSGFTRYLDSSYYYYFYINFYFYSLRMKTFIKGYFKRNIKKRFKEDLLFCIKKCLNELFLNFFKGKLGNRLGYSYDRGDKSTVINEVLQKKVNVSLKISLYPLNSFIILTYLYKSLQKFAYPGYVGDLNYFLVLIRDIPIFKFFYFGFRSNDKSGKTLFDVAEVLDDFTNKTVKVGPHKDINIIFDKKVNFISVSPNLSFNNFSSLLSSFNKFFSCVPVKRI